MLRLNSILASNSLAKIIACCIAFTLWSLWSDIYVIQASYVVPLVFKASQTSGQSSPASDRVRMITVTLRGLRKYLRAIESNGLRVSLPIDYVTPGRPIIKLTSQHLGLPSCITVVNYNPINIAPAYLTETV